MKTKLFQPDARVRSDEHKRIYALYELAYTIVDVGAAVAFVIGSFLFLSEKTQTAGTWFFIVGSFLFLAKPAIRFKRELKLLSLGKTTKLAKRDGWSKKQSGK
ncbi:YrhK family protein [Tianweitania sp. BSSL-BM11]|uniref:YrhK family protein n=1 Tax=Tianweitania aestuarii TaxID=2814886 RepID=A0ABS5RU51_9HYPH|nr:YrhK family protein [Tianweitania aestuarii]MBS9720579.1 YrhK family protein [Tianweitania aestuarii]